MSEDDLEKIKSAHAVAKQYHSNQRRQSKEAYITHLEQVSLILADLNQQASTIQAGLLHDILEDTDYSESELKETFGETVFDLVHGVTKLERINYPSNIEQQAENYRKLLIAMAKDIRVMIIKLADRLHNMRTINFLRPDKQRRIAKETLEIYAPLAHRLGIGHLKWELEDLSFAALHPDDFHHIKELINKKRNERETIIAAMCMSVNSLLSEHNITADVSGRPKHFYSIYKKLYQEQIEFSQLFDLYGIRIITSTVAECYQVLGYVHTKYKPVGGRLKDYIALPKSNLYQSLHTTVIGPNGHRIEIQIRTQDMHKISEYGIAAHWTYKENAPNKKNDVDFSWLRQILDEKNQGADHFIESLKINLYDDEVFVFTPKGDILILPKGATILDAAFKIHTDIGFKFKAGIVNGKIVPIHYILRNGDQIDIQTKSKPQPNLGWLDIVTTRFSKSKIKAHFKKQDTDLRIKLGETKLKKFLLKYGFITSKKDPISQFLDRISSKTNYKTHHDILLGITNNEVSEPLIVKCCKDETSDPDIDDFLTQKKSKKVTRSLVSVDGEMDIETHIAKCCQPLPGDPIIGFITRGFGVAIHHRNCKVLQHNKERHGSRMTPVSWLNQSQSIYATDIQLTVLDRPGLLKDIFEQLTKFHINVTKASTRVYKNGHAKIFLTCDIRKYEELSTLKQQLLLFEDVLDVQRRQ
jgi:GTP diphosphokinase / guanosine-3',5'-bis(diphosphate) 3'-diphosphatase